MSSELEFPPRGRYTKTFMITSVRGADDEERARQVLARDTLRELGIEAYLPFEDTDQVDSSGGIRIVTDNFNAIREVVLDDEGFVSLLYCPTSSGSFADIGTAMTLSMIHNKRLKIHVLNPNELNVSRSARFVDDLETDYENQDIVEMVAYVQKAIQSYQENKVIHFTWEGTKDDEGEENGFLKSFRLGVMTAMMLENNDAVLDVSNLDEVVIPEGAPKSYQHVIHSLVNRGGEI